VGLASQALTESQPEEVKQTPNKRQKISEKKEKVIEVKSHQEEEKKGSPIINDNVNKMEAIP
jgi:hypothetical protein